MLRHCILSAQHPFFLVHHVVQGRLLGIKEPFTPAVAEVAVALSGGCDPQVAQQAARVYRELEREESRFLGTLEAGQKVLQQVISEAAGAGSTVEGAKVRSSVAVCMHDVHVMLWVICTKAAFCSCFALAMFARTNNICSSYCTPTRCHQAFLLYDTFGFPLEITQELAAEAGLSVDLVGFQAEMDSQRRRSKEALAAVDLTAQAALGGLVAEVGATEFLGYDDTSAEGTVVALMSQGKSVQEAAAGTMMCWWRESRHVGQLLKMQHVCLAGCTYCVHRCTPCINTPCSIILAGDVVEVVLDRTPFYAESGGQVGDRGRLQVVSPSGAAALLTVSDVRGAAGGDLHVHAAEVVQGSLRVGDRVVAEVDERSRHRARCNHTSTHLLQSALKQVLGEEVGQQVRC